MTERQHRILSLALIYMRANIDDVCDAFVGDEEGNNEDGLLIVNGEEMAPPTEDETSALLKEFQ